MVKLKSLLNEVVRLNSIKEVEALKPKLAAVAQEVYDAWQISDDGYDELNGGGICHLIADELVSVLSEHNIDRCQTVSSTHEQHVYVVGQFREGVYLIDVPYRYYETGGGYSWKKIPDVKFDESFINIEPLNYNPRKFSQYIDPDF